MHFDIIDMFFDILVPTNEHSTEDEVERKKNKHEALFPKGGRFGGRGWGLGRGGNFSKKERTCPTALINPQMR